ncbi:MAG: hypothetical protein FJX75_25970, partial [Armatimonadetes bacterium]|nr:hypothetical protein [Armatimonadota bacterium]
EFCCPWAMLGVTAMSDERERQGGDVGGSSGGGAHDPCPGNSGGSPGCPSTTPPACESDTFTKQQWRARAAAKRCMAAYILDHGLIRPRHAVLLDAGSTVGWVGREVFRRERVTCLNLTIMTNNMGIWNDFNDTYNPEDPESTFAPRPAHSLALLLTGGKYDQQHDALFGSQAAHGLRDFNPHVVVMGTSGFTFNENGGLYYHGHTEEELVKKAMWSKPTEHRVIMCDHTKIGRKDSFLGGPIGQLMQNADRCTVVTSSPAFETMEPPAETDEEKEQLGLRVAEYEATFEAQKTRFLEIVQQRPPRQHGLLVLAQVRPDGDPILYGSSD